MWETSKKSLFILIQLLPIFTFPQSLGDFRYKKNPSQNNLETNLEILEPEMNDEIESSFYITEISDEVFVKIQGKSFKENCTIPRSDLRHLHLLHKDLNGTSLEGEMICNKKIAEILLEIFKKLYQANYPIEKIRLVDEYDADDEKSMSDNNSSCFNFRFISHTTTVSKHGAGLAVDINPLYNPYYKTVKGKPNVEPFNGAAYLDRKKDFPYKIDHNDLAFKLFSEAGFEWGGDWKGVKDYQHFEWVE